MENVKNIPEEVRQYPWLHYFSRSKYIVLLYDEKGNPTRRPDSRAQSYAARIRALDLQSADRRIGNASDPASSYQDRVVPQYQEGTGIALRRSGMEPDPRSGLNREHGR